MDPASAMVLTSVVTAAAAHVGSEAARRALADLSALARRLRGGGPQASEGRDGTEEPDSADSGDSTDSGDSGDSTERPAGADGTDGAESAAGSDPDRTGTGDGAPGPGTAEDAAASGPEALRDYTEELLRQADHDPALARELEDWARRHAPALGVTDGGGTVNNSVSGDARISGPVVQARDISGGITFGGPER